MPTLRKGSKGRPVMIWQVVLKIKIDGIFGNETEKATIKYQKENGLEADGVVGFYTWSKGIEEVAKE